MFKNKGVVIGTVIVIVILIVGSLLFLFPKSETTTQIPANSSNNIKKLTPFDIGLILTPRSDGKAINMKITKLKGIVSVEYDVSYDAEVTDEGETAVVPRGVSGSPVKITAGESEIERDLDLGTCSKNVCKYDKVVSDVTFTLRINFKDGTIGGVETKIKL